MSPVGFELTTLTITHWKSDAYSTLPPRHVLNRRPLNWTFFMLYFMFGLGSFLDSKEHDFIRVWQSETGKGWQIGRVGWALASKTSDGYCCEFNSHWGQLCFLMKYLKTSRCQYYTEMSDLCCKQKPRMNPHLKILGYKILCFSIVNDHIYDQNIRNDSVRKW